MIGVEIQLQVDRARDVAKKHNHTQVDTEHLLWGVIHSRKIEDILHGLGIEQEKLKMELKAILCEHNVSQIKDEQCLKVDYDFNRILHYTQVSVEKPSMSQIIEGEPPFTPETVKALCYAKEEAQKFEYDWIDNEYIFLGLIQEENGIASKLLAKFGITLEKVYTCLVPHPILTLSTGEVNLNDVDSEIRELVRLLNKSSCLETRSSCSGHPGFPMREWRDGGITMYPLDGFEQAWSFLERIRLLLNNNPELLLSAKDNVNINQTLKLYKEARAEILYASAIPILKLDFYSSIRPITPVESLPSAWDIILKATQEFIGSRNPLPCIKTPKEGVDAFVELLRSISHIQELTTWVKPCRTYDPEDLYPDSWWFVGINFLWQKDSIQWGWNFVNYLKIQLDKELKEFTKGELGYYRHFGISPIIRHDDFQRTREDHLKIWKLIELAVQELLRSENSLDNR